MKNLAYLLVGKLLCRLGFHKKRIMIYNNQPGHEYEHWQYSCERECGWETAIVPRNPGDTKPRTE